MAGASWAELYESIEMVPSRGLQVAKPTTDVIEQYEMLCNFRLPRSYVDFISVFGPGELGERYLIRAPGYSRMGHTQDVQVFNAQTDLGAFNESLRLPENPLEESFVLDYYQNPEVVSRLVCFADNTISELIGWDPDDVRDASRNEYAIYMLVRDNEVPSFVTDSFTSFIEDMCFGLRYFEVCGEPTNDLSLVPPKNFRPASFVPYSRG